MRWLVRTALGRSTLPPPPHSCRVWPVPRPAQVPLSHQPATLSLPHCQVGRGTEVCKVFSVTMFILSPLPLFPPSLSQTLPCLWLLSRYIIYQCTPPGLARPFAVCYSAQVIPALLLLLVHSSPTIITFLLFSTSICEQAIATY